MINKYDIFKTFTILIVLYNLLDMLLTIVGVFVFNLTEANPTMSFILDYNLILAIIIKIIISGIFFLSYINVDRETFYLTKYITRFYFISYGIVFVFYQTILIINCFNILNVIL